MKTQPITTPRKSFRGRFIFLLILATFSPASLVCAQTSTSTYRAKHHVSVAPKKVEDDRVSDLVSAVKEQQEQIRLQQNELENLLKRLGGLKIPGTLTIGDGTAIKRVISVTQTVVFSNANSSSVDVSVPGAQLTDLVMISVPDLTPEYLIIRGAVVNTDKVRVRVHRAGLSGPNVPTQPILCRIVVIGF